MELTVTVMVVVSTGIVPPLPGPVPVIVIVYVPVAALTSWMVNVDVAGVTAVTTPATLAAVVGSTGLGLKLAVIPLGVVAVS